VWGAVAWIIFALVWPAGWQNPAGAPYTVVHNAFLSATDTVEAEAESYWLVPDLGPFYYLVNGAFKLSPFATLGLIAWMWLTLTRRRKPSSVEWWLLVFAVLFTIFMTVGGKRSSRYILPAWPALYLPAAAGLAQISESANTCTARRRKCQQISKSPTLRLRSGQASNLQPFDFAQDGSRISSLGYGGG
jgi:hypothetical protein